MGSIKWIKIKCVNGVKGRARMKEGQWFVPHCCRCTCTYVWRKQSDDYCVTVDVRSLLCQLKNSCTKSVVPVALVHGRPFLTSVSAVAVRTIQDITPWTSLTASRKNYGVKTRNAARSLDRNQSDAMAGSWFVSRRYYTAVCYSFYFNFGAADE